MTQVAGAVASTFSTQVATSRLRGGIRVNSNSPAVQGWELSEAAAARNTTRSRRGSVGTAARSLRRGATRVAAQRPPGDSATVRAAPLGGSGCFKVSLLLALPGARRAEFRTDYAAIRSTSVGRRRVLRRAAQRRLQLPFWAYIAKTNLAGSIVGREAAEESILASHEPSETPETRTRLFLLIASVLRR